MDLIPEDQVKRFETLQWAPMVDFLFIVLIVFATLAITRTGLFDKEVNLVQVSNQKKTPQSSSSGQARLVNVSVNANGRYKWITDKTEYYVDNAAALQQKLISDQLIGLLPRNPKKTKVLLHIDKKAPWEAIAELIYALREKGFPVHPVYQSNQAPLEP
jgi:biopolymer transport protein ExbD